MHTLNKRSKCCAICYTVTWWWSGGGSGCIHSLAFICTYARPLIVSHKLPFFTLVYLPELRRCTSLLSISSVSFGASHLRALILSSCSFIVILISILIALHCITCIHIELNIISLPFMQCVIIAMIVVFTTMRHGQSGSNLEQLQKQRTRSLFAQKQ